MPRSSVTATPGSTPPVESETVPVKVASCAHSRAGSSRIAPRNTSRPTTLDLIQPPVGRTPEERIVDAVTGPYYLLIVSVKKTVRIRRVPCRLQSQRDRFGTATLADVFREINGLKADGIIRERHEALFGR